MAANNQLRTNLNVSEDSFYIIDGEDTTKSIQFQFAGDFTGAKTITMPNSNVDLTSLAGGIALDEIGVGDAGGVLATTVGGISIGVPTATGVSIKIANALEANFITASLVLGDGTAKYTLTHAGDSAADDFEITHTGANDSSLILSSEGTGSDAIDIAATGEGGGVSIGANTAVSLEIGDVPQMVVRSNTMDLGVGTEAYTITHTGDSLADDLNITHTSGGGADTSFILNSDGTGLNAIKLNATVGGINIDGKTAVDLKYNTTSQIKITDGDADLKSNASFTFNHDTNAANQDLTIAHNGAYDSTFELLADGTSARALTLYASTGGVSISSAGTDMGSGVTINKYTTMWGVSATSSGSATDVQIWSVDLGTADAATGGMYYAKACVTAFDSTNSKGANVEHNAVLAYNGTTLSIMNGGSMRSGIGNGIGTGNIIQLADVRYDVSDNTNVALLIDNQSTSNVLWQGMVTVTKATF